ncbi:MULTISPECIES: enolase C-terminal domain-like protein [Rhodococcus]|uniref:enolase C-terminal domain-like protein n=1 Tax=Rhodococcus TaxID=1827 RepID=UPI00081A4CC6|nr:MULTISPECIES: enolase C-terminal domain-like protein [Rhodococcus]ANZ23747.1 fuconate dehydratase [Rhodococcus sp. WB1]MBC2589182.1 fuconate dehydratase [Rhodococcus aetherivorans]QRI78846.1 fuconate dehydratase [Rhodococcus aetherivorans]QSE62068.1 fuconate dehydratase [Rhodococcus sp. PSBB066]QSE72037.1 fuconate dehydratase [Rhodococcus sp. PSBB049]
MSHLVSITTDDVRFPTSLELDGSDAVNVDPDYSAAYVTIRTDAGDEGHGFVFTCGRGNDVVTHAIDTYAQLLIGRNTEELIFDLGAASKRLVHDSQLRWLGPEKGVSQMACGALINALWDIRARREGKPLWLLLSTMSPEEIVDVVDFTHIRDSLDPARALDLLQRGSIGKADRIAALQAGGYPAYTTSPGWLGYSDEKLVRLSKEAAADGFSMIKLKVGGSVEDDLRRLALARKAVGDLPIAIDANQRWEVSEAIDRVNELAQFDPYWIEEPTSTDDILGHADIRKGVAPTRVATGEAVANRIVFKQLLQAQAIDVLQLDSTRVAGVNENIAVMLLAARFGVPVCPHAGGVGLCELVQHFSFFDYAALSGSQEGRMIEYVDHLHEHFAEPVRIVGGRYAAPALPGIGAEMLAASRERWVFPTGPGWREVNGRAATTKTGVEVAP